MRIIILGFLALMAVYVGVISAMVAFSGHLIYHFNANTDVMETEEDFTLFRYENIEAWYSSGKPGRAPVIFIPGNTGDLGHGVVKTAELRALGHPVYIYNYPGANGTSGSPSEFSIMSEVVTLEKEIRFRHATAPILYGVSLGTAPISALAEQLQKDQRDVSAVILEMPFTSIYDMALESYAFLPPFDVMFFGDAWRTKNAVSKVNYPLIVVHGEKDELIPFEQGRSVFESSPTDRKSFISITEGTHYNLTNLGSNAEIIESMRLIGAL